MVKNVDSYCEKIKLWEGIIYTVLLWLFRYFNKELPECFYVYLWCGFRKIKADNFSRAEPVESQLVRIFLKDVRMRTELSRRSIESNYKFLFYLSHARKLYFQIITYLVYSYKLILHY
jgi:hypothetical protein